MIKPTTSQLKAWRFRDDGLCATYLELEVRTNNGYRFPVAVDVERKCLHKTTGGAYLWAVPGGGMATVADLSHFESYDALPKKVWELSK